MRRMDQLMAEFLASQVTGYPDELVLHTRVLFQEIGQGFGVLLLFGQITDGNPGALTSKRDCSIGNQL